MWLRTDGGEPPRIAKISLVQGARSLGVVSTSDTKPSNHKTSTTVRAWRWSHRHGGGLGRFPSGVSLLEDAFACCAPL